MGIFDMFKSIGKNYKTKVRCYNCDSVQEINVPKGSTIDEFIISTSAICNSCGCNTLKRVIVVNKVGYLPKTKEMIYPAKPEEQPRPRLKPMKKIIRKPMQRRSFREPEYEYQYNEVQNPAPPQPQQPKYEDFSLKTKKGVNFWTGKEI